jgi:glycine cleavage system aminomethyltransferase T
MARGALIQAPLAGVRAFITRLDADGEPGYTMMVARDEAAYVWDALLEIGTAHGLVPVGPDAVAADGGTR